MHHTRSSLDGHYCTLAMHMLVGSGDVREALALTLGDYLRELFGDAPYPAKLRASITPEMERLAIEAAGDAPLGSFLGAQRALDAFYSHPDTYELAFRLMGPE